MESHHRWMPTGCLWNMARLLPAHGFTHHMEGLLPLWVPPPWVPVWAVPRLEENFWVSPLGLWVPSLPTWSAPGWILLLPSRLGAWIWRWALGVPGSFSWVLHILWNLCCSLLGACPGRCLPLYVVSYTCLLPWTTWVILWEGHLGESPRCLVPFPEVTSPVACPWVEGTTSYGCHSPSYVDGFLTTPCPGCPILTHAYLGLPSPSRVYPGVPYLGLPGSPLLPSMGAIEFRRHPILYMMPPMMP